MVVKAIVVIVSQKRKHIHNIPNQNY